MLSNQLAKLPIILGKEWIIGKATFPNGVCKLKKNYINKAKEIRKNYQYLWGE